MSGKVIKSLGEGERAGAAHGDRPRASDETRQRLIRRTTIKKCPIVADIAGVGAATQCSGSANLQRASADGCRASVGVRAREGQRARTGFDDATGGTTIKNAIFQNTEKLQ